MIRYISVFFFIVVVVMNYLANSLPLNGKTTGEISAAYPNLFVPAGVTFSIWGIIYLLVAAFCIIQFQAGFKDIAIRIGWFFIASCIFNVLWLFAWHYQKLYLSMLAMTGLLLALILLNMQVKELSPGWLKAAFGIYLGWICIATIANATALLVSTGWKGFGLSQETWTILMIAAGTVIVSLAVLRIDNPFIGLAVVWAFLGIILNRSGDYRSIVTAAIAGIVIVGVATVLRFISSSHPTTPSG